MGSLSNRAANDRSPLTRMIKNIIMLETGMNYLQIE